MDNTSTLKEELKEVDEREAELKLESAFGTAIEELHEHPAFKLVIEDGYMEDEAQRILGVLTTPMNMKREKNEDMIAKLESIRHLREYFKTKLILAQSADANLPEMETSRKEITSRFAEDNDDIIDVEAE